LFSYLLFLYSSFAFIVTGFSGYIHARYKVEQYMIAVFLLGTVFVKLYQFGGFKKQFAYSLVIPAILVSAATYEIPLINAEFSELYANYISFYDARGDERMSLFLPPTFAWTNLDVPVNFPEGFSEDLWIDVNTINGIYDATDTSETIFPIPAGRVMNNVYGWAQTSDQKTFDRLWMYRDGVYYPTLIYPRPDISEFFNDPGLEHSGFLFQIPSSFFSEGIHNYEFIGRTPDGKFHRGFCELNISFNG
jgi:hypothetical protein